MRKLTIAFVLLMLAACKHGPSKLEKAMDSWVGEPAGKLLASWGAPDTSVKLNDGSTVMTWKRIWFRNDVRHECRRSFTIGPDERVKSWTYQDC